MKKEIFIASLKMTREEDIWHCLECGNPQGRHDMWFEGDICSNCNKENLEKMKLENTWDFVQAYYPKYHSCNEIAENDDLQKIIDGEINGVSEEMYDEKFKEQKSLHGGMLDDSQIEEEVLKIFQARLHESNAYIFEKAIETYIALDAEAENSKSTYYLFGEDAVREYDENGIEGVLERIEENDLSSPVTFQFIEGETKSAEFAEAISGWNDYSIITEEEFNQL